LAVGRSVCRIRVLEQPKSLPAFAVRTGYFRFRGRAVGVNLRALPQARALQVQREGIKKNMKSRIITLVLVFRWARNPSRYYRSIDSFNIDASFRQVKKKLDGELALDQRIPQCFSNVRIDSVNPLANTQVAKGTTMRPKAQRNRRSESLMARRRTGKRAGSERAQQWSRGNTSSASSEAFRRVRHAQEPHTSTTSATDGRI
jgi:hypothetical protein